jgi:vacuolar-type H+-ATPase subunit C/Vma6
MAVREIALVARARGLATHVLSRETLETLADAEDLDAFMERVSRLGASVEPAGEPRDTIALERAVRQTAARHLATLRRWQDRTPNVLDVFAAFQDRRSLRSLLRGAAEGAPPNRRLAGLLPTVSLPEDVLSALARLATPLDVVRHLVRSGHPDVQRLRAVVSGSQTDLLSVEVELLRRFSRAVTTTAAHGDHVLRDFVRSVVDLANAQNALQMGGEPRDLDTEAMFVRGGRWLTLEAFVAIVRSASADAALAALAAAVRPSPLASWLPVVARDLAHLDRAFLTGWLAALTSAMRLDPLGGATVLRLLLLIEAQSRDLRALAWGAALRVPAPQRRQSLVTPA